MERLINELAEIENEYEQLKLDLVEEKANITLDTDWEKALNKAKPTVGEKEAYIKRQTLPLERRIKILKVKRNTMRRIYDIRKNIKEQEQ